MKRASAFLRAIAFLIDLLVLAMAGLLFRSFNFLGYAVGSGGSDGGSSSLPLGFLSILVGIFYFTFLTMDGAQTIGKRCMDIHVTRIGGEGAGFLRSLWRTCCYLLSALPFFFGFVLAFAIRGRSLHDFLAGTIVVEEE